MVGGHSLLQTQFLDVVFISNCRYHTAHTSHNPASILYKSTAGRYRPVSYPDGPITARYRFK